ncbi:aminodeoxychorismate/anthranilate synthase component II [Alicyclobacillus sp. SO9]|uniref:anthranilate synthase component II n=1 Tax=Alicyclobacillus sp. SO9 TaxID=2665646 RepID=UPI0018E7FEC4|nr:aminodeoxychorismate/anthranilate synthase component II [Alicyclobacillus sp. SO9]QQE80606.1 aminodeoxychorismate/anthranilate synthase component II [Alicyclobacillus sp. SO9]
MLLVLDNFDSFTFNLVQYCGELGAEVTVRRNNISLENLVRLQPEALLVSPGPGTPLQAGSSMDAIRYFSGRIPVFGVCLGHQVLAQAYGGTILRSPELRHGKTSPVHHDGTDPLFSDVPPVFQATRYHSLIVDPATLPSCFDITAWTEDAIMAIRHKETGAAGVQFHPESVLTPSGKQILGNFLQTFMSKVATGVFSA